MNVTELHELRDDLPNWDTKQHCTCGYESVSKCEQWKHQADALRGDVKSLTRERDAWEESVAVAVAEGDKWEDRAGQSAWKCIESDRRVEVLTSALRECRRLLFLNPHNADVYEQRAILDDALAAISLPEPSEGEAV